jgi:hypothetical protein
MKKKSLKQISQNDPTTPYMVGEEIFASTSTRRNAAGTIDRTDRFKNIDDGLTPFKNNGSAYGKNNSTVDVRDAVILCQKCYYNFAIFRNIIDLMTEFSINNIFFKGGSEKSRDFFKALFNKINLWDFQDKFFREYYRSGNVPIYRFDASIQPSEVTKIIQTFGEEGKLEEKVGNNKEMSVEKLKIPSRYIILNPADIQMIGSANFGQGNYFKLLNEYEVSRLKDPKTDEDKEILESLSPETQKEIRNGSRSVLIKLSPEKVTFVFYKKQDYEPFAVPMGYPVLEDINAKHEMKKIDMAIARTMQQIILLITNGAEPEKGGINQKNIDALKGLFVNQSVGRVLVADYTTKAEWKVPAISDLLNPEKYAILERDINIGLNNVFAGEEKFANQAQKVELFIARLEQARKAFLNNFLIPEVKRIAKSLNFKNFPTPYFEDIELKDNTNFAKLYVRLMELGILTPEQGLKAIESNTLPDETIMVEEQEKYKKEREKDLYKPLVGGAKEDGEAGKPGGLPAAPKKVSPIGASEEKYSLKKIKENLVLAQNLEESVLNEIKLKHKIKKVTRLQKEVAEQITNLIIANEEPLMWSDSSKIREYLESPEDKNKDRVNEVIEIAASHSIDNFLAGILLASKLLNA